ncbi:MAG TPA: VWA domain-containing protein [Pyrinomonadaceae bacterium]|nr:VWA domain-containing protein [Pyrinomonadaceae bacterium]
MTRNLFLRRAFTFCAMLLCGLLLLEPTETLRAQSRRLPPTTDTQQQKKNKRPDPSEQKEQEPDPQDVLPEVETVKVSTSLVNVEAVVYHKKSGKIIQGLKKENFAVFEDGVQQPITNFSTPEAPITVSVVLEYSKLGSMFGFYGSGGQEPGRYEVLRPLAAFVSQVVRPPDDYVSVIAYDMRATPITDFTNDPQRLNAVVNLLLRNHPVSNEANLFDALKLTLIGGRAESVVLDNPKETMTEYAGMASLQGRRKAIFLVSSGIDTFSRTNYDQARKIAQNAGVPIYIIGTGNLFFKKYGDQMGALDGLGGATTPGRMTMLQAQNALKTFARETGGEYFPITFEGEISSALQSINALMRSQYSLGYNPGDRRDGKQHKIVVKVDVDGDGQFDDKEYVVKNRQFYNAPKS